jgi:hypothetical protein
MEHKDPCNAGNPLPPQIIISINPIRVQSVGNSMFRNGAAVIAIPFTLARGKTARRVRTASRLACRSSRTLAVGNLALKSRPRGMQCAELNFGLARSWPNASYMPVIGGAFQRRVGSSNSPRIRDRAPHRAWQADAPWHRRNEDRSLLRAAQRRAAID